MKTFLGTLIIAVSLAGSAVAVETSPLKALLTGEDTRGWEAVGRLNIANKAFCTGALISPDLVLTAAHCLFDRETGQQYEAKDIEFLAGWRNGSANAYAKLRRAIPHPEYEYRNLHRQTLIANDVALLQLAHPIKKSAITPFQTAPRPRKNAEVGVVSYARGRADNPSLQRVCHVLARRSGTLLLSCDVDFGSSGAPIFTIDDDGVARIVSVVSSKGQIDGRRVALGTSLEGPLDDLMALMDVKVGIAAPKPGATVKIVQESVAKVETKTQPKTKPVQTKPRVRLPGADRAVGGAKFVRP